MNALLLFCFFVTCSAVDYRSGCRSASNNAKFFNNEDCVHHIDMAMQMDHGFSLRIDEANFVVWNELLRLTDKHGYEFSKSLKTTDALKRVARNVQSTMREWAKTGAEGGAQLGFALCLGASLLDNPKCGASTWCHVFEATLDAVGCSALGYVEGGLRGGILGAIVGLAKGVIEAFEEFGQIRVSFRPAGSDL
ncbi:unnamed protein product [Symbiodinium necroappetens]|uniref:Uncharacterized protein n=1 Tax=Symbiodinium necroappetens TaxID=1628268 RepID=A0A813APL9_9DINO|nr:unnamed protein product [Symbiodinium necroappetens]|eukprot:CAMPEP_0181464646 /NCGR_PEP_ID=MMETSP1110-20121109/35541_1 /TAXON_ID=174948 /ORGANISM="Symbiodinium sp., Strain CCMP421" /LENGTH=192 /DNA_ID=CAMNT_0023589389 /DNA_START=68 /DNA_END=646 /DNA_ORIENTATION=-